ncbi:ATP-binding protein [Ferruginibacter paludis]|uniref:ATP-binding protein n=1 Tax=Ferruginibacter paludis TaxID=1310417 RepID=UPI0025B55585|nr:ATP-binding protein [Ferruginibacter paludis]MDN3657811.1 ATP-binding protein [Ferruginibacter paludis]
MYNITGGLLPDENLPGSFFLQNVIAYATGFITPCFFPYYVHKAFALEKMRFHAFKGVYLFLILPYFLFVVVFAITEKLEDAKDLLALPVVYALWVIISMIKAIRYKYKKDFSSRESKEEMTVLLISLTPWVMLPVIDFFNMGQGTEACITNIGFLSLFALQMKRHIHEMRAEHNRLVESQKELQNWNSNLTNEVTKRTKELEIINQQRTNTLVNLAHETKTPLTLINNYLEEYIQKTTPSEELNIVKRNINKLSSDIVNLFDIEKFNKGFAVYNHNQLCNFSDILKDSMALFEKYAIDLEIKIEVSIHQGIIIQADPLSINRIINNLIENAMKFSEANDTIEIALSKNDDGDIQFIVSDRGIGIPLNMQAKIFEPYYQLNSQKANTQGMGLGLPIVKKVVEELNGKIYINSNPQKARGTKIKISLKAYKNTNSEPLNAAIVKAPSIQLPLLTPTDKVVDKERFTVLVIEDNIAMINYLTNKLSEKYNVLVAMNGSDGLRKLKEVKVVPDLIVTDIMMDKIDGYEFAKIISKSEQFAHIPIIFLSAKAALKDKLQGLKLGAIDYVPKPFSIAEFLYKVDSILTYAGKQKRSILNMTFDRVSSNGTSHQKIQVSSFELNCDLYNLTARERDIAKLICQGQKYKDIGGALFIAERTVTKHAQNIFEKLQVSNKIELINKLEYSQTA